MKNKKTLRSFINRLRQQLALLLLASGPGTVNQTACHLNYSTPYHFSRQFFNTLRFRPSQWPHHICR